MSHALVHLSIVDPCTVAQKYKKHVFEIQV